MKIVKILLMVAFLIHADGVIASPINDVELFRCTSFGGPLGDCKVEQVTLDSAKLYEATFDVAYEFQCRGNSVDIGVDLDGRYLPFVMGNGSGVQTLSGLIGSGELKVRDQNPSKTARGTFSSDCSLKVKSVQSRASDRQISLWNTSKSSILSDLRNYETARDGFTELVGYKKAFSFLETLHQSILQDVGLSKETRAMLAPGGEIAGLLETLAYQTVTLDDPDTVTVETTTLSTAEKKPISRLADIIALMPADAECDAVTTDGCEKVKLSKYLSSEESTLLGTVAAYALTADKAQVAQTRFTTLVKEKEQQLISLCSYARLTNADLGWTAEESARYCVL